MTILGQLVAQSKTGMPKDAPPQELAQARLAPEVPLRGLALDEQRCHKMRGEGSQGAERCPRLSLRGCPKDGHG